MTQGLFLVYALAELFVVLSIIKKRKSLFSKISKGSYYDTKEIFDLNCMYDLRLYIVYALAELL